MAFQKQGTGDEQYRILDPLQEFINQREGTFKGKREYYSKARSFFRKDRAPLPEDDFRINGSQEPTRERLSVERARYKEPYRSSFNTPSDT